MMTSAADYDVLQRCSSFVHKIGRVTVISWLVIAWCAILSWFALKRDRHDAALIELCGRSSVEFLGVSGLMLGGGCFAWWCWKACMWAAVAHPQRDDCLASMDLLFSASSALPLLLMFLVDLDIMLAIPYQCVRSGETRRIPVSLLMQACVMLMLIVALVIKFSGRHCCRRRTDSRVSVVEFNSNSTYQEI